MFGSLVVTVRLEVLGLFQNKTFHESSLSEFGLEVFVILL